MSDNFTCLSLEELLHWIKREEPTGKIFGIPQGLFFRPAPNDLFRIKRYGRLLETPVGVAAGPHTQLSQNIVSAYLTGARYIELKTVQVLDELDVTKPCINMEDEGYNCEWSQELRLHNSFDQYLNALIAVHLLKKRFEFGDGSDPGFIFNMSVGYNLEGILSDTVLSFLDSMADAGEDIAARLELAQTIFPEAADLVIDPCISNNITISTMHGCPPDEIEKIGRYFIEERKLNTTIKLNPTLLGPAELREILNNRLGFDVTVPDIAFDHDLKYDAGVQLIRNLQHLAKDSGVEFGLKLTNTLESRNEVNRLPENEKMVYMSGRPLHVIATHLAARLQQEFDGGLDISFSAGVDCFNIAEVLGCGLQPVTVCSDLLKPGGYGRIGQYLKNISEALEKEACSSIAEFVDKRRKVVGGANTAASLRQYAGKLKADSYYHKKRFPWKNVKTPRKLGFFDCITAPCKGTCPAGQDVPTYMYYTARGMFREAFEAILRTNPFPNVQGLVCDHPCTEKCTRINYDEPLKIREIKRCIALSCRDIPAPVAAGDNNLKAAVIGGGPSGFSAAYFLRLHGFAVELFEAKSFGGGMAANAIPSFRLDDASITADIERIIKMGVAVHYDSPVDRAMFDEIRENSDYVYIGVGAAAPYTLDIPGAQGEGVYDQLEFLRAVRRGESVDIGNTIAVIGGGNSAMDAARTAKRLVGEKGKVIVHYRRNIAQMPADREEVEAVIGEKIEIRQMINPMRVLLSRGRVTGLICQRMVPGPLDDSGRPRPVAVKGSEFEFAVDTVISAIGQRVVIPFLENKLTVDPKTCQSELGGVYAGGDAIRGASTLVKAIGDGRRAVRSILVDAALTKPEARLEKPVVRELQTLEEKMAERVYAAPFFQGGTRSLGFDLESKPLSREAAIEEASRCLSCDTLCNICTTVCPNRANIGYCAAPFKKRTYRVVAQNKEVAIEKLGFFTVDQPHQVINIGDFCNECGNCTTFCPSAGSPYLDKPTFYLSKDTLEAENSGFMIGEKVIHKRVGEVTRSLREEDDSYRYISELVTAQVDKESFTILDISLKEDVADVDLTEIAELGYLYQALRYILGQGKGV